MSARGPLAALIGPSLLSSDLANMGADARKAVQEWGADYLHVDIMDGHFVPNLTFGPPVVKCLRKHTEAFLDCHLMVSNPEQWVDALAEAGANRFIFHSESTDNVNALIEKVKQTAMEVGIVIKPGTTVDSILPFVSAIDMVLIMTVEPGFGGQSFMPEMMDKVRLLRSKFPTLHISVDGGISLDTIDEAAKAGANLIIAGSAVFKAADPKAVVDGLRSSVAAQL